MLRSIGLEVVAKATIVTTTTAPVGTDWAKLGAAGGGPVACNQCSIYNTTGVELQVAYCGVTDTVPTGETFEIPAGASYAFRGINNTRAIAVRRTDTNNAQVTFKAIVESV